MIEDCRNDCLESLSFPRRPVNRPGLSHIKYRIGTYADIREALLRNLDKTPSLAQWTHRGADDPGIALLEGAAILGDILTFYEELYANEAYLRTAQWRESIADLVRLLGYRLSPGLAGNGTFAFEIKGDQPVTIPANFPLKAEVEGLTKPADFETSEEAIAYPWLSKFSLYSPLATPPISAATNEFYIQTPDQLLSASPIVLKAGDRLMMGEIDSAATPRRLNNAEIVIVDSVRELHGIKLFKIKGKLQRGVKAPPLGNVAQLAAYKLGRSFHHFGHNGPRTLVKAPDPVTSTVTDNGDGTTTVESDPPLEFDISFFRNINANTASNNIAGVSPKPKPKAAAPASAPSGATIDFSGFGATYAAYTTEVYVPLELSYTATYVAKAVVIADPTLSKTEFPVDAEVQDLATGVTLIMQGPLYGSSTGGSAGQFAIVRDLADIRTTSVTWGLATGTVSMLTLSQSLDTSADSHNYMDIRQVQFHEALSPLLTLRAAMQPATPAVRNTLNFYGSTAQAQALVGRPLIFTKPGNDPLTVLVNSVEAASSTDGTHPLLHKVTIDRGDLDYADFPDAPPYVVTVYGNIVEATQGKTEAQVPLGNGDNRLAFQTFKLPKSPLTYLLSKSESPPEVPELQIYVNNRLWERVSSFFDRKPDDEIYIVREDPDNNSWVQFGDGQTGERLPSGVKNVMAVYRTGTGAFGALKANTKVQGGGKLNGLDKIQMPDVASGGSQPEDGENAREAAPGKIQSLDRLVSLEDFESEALAIGGVSKVSAAWQLVNGIPAVVLTILMETGRDAELKQVQETLTGYNQGRGPNRFPINVQPGQLKYVVVNATFGYDSTYLEAEIMQAVQKALGVNSGKPNVLDDQSGLFSLRRRRFGQPEYATSVAGTIQQVAGVVWAQVTRFDSLGPIADPTAFSPPGTPVVVQDPVICEGGNLLSLYSGHLQLIGVAETLREVS